MPRTVTKKPCRFCQREIDSRGHRMHELSCSENPVNSEDKKPSASESMTHDVDRDRLNGNLQELIRHVYDQGLNTGIAVGKKIA